MHDKAYFHVALAFKVLVYSPT